MSNIVAATPLARFYHWEESQPEVVFLRQPKTIKDATRQWTEYTWQEAGRQARCIAAALQKSDLPKGSRISVLSPNCAHWVLADLAIMMSGYVSAPTFTTMDAKSINYVIEHADVKAFFIGDITNWNDIKDVIPQDIQLITFPGVELGSSHQFKAWDNLVAESHPLLGIDPPDENDLYTIIYTSGTTGLPKGVMLSFLSAGACAENISLHVNSNKNDRFLSFLPLAHGAERVIVEGQALYCGGQITFNESQLTFLNDIIESKPTIILAVPRIWTKLQQLCIAKANAGNIDDLSPNELEEIGRNARTLLGMDNVRIALTGAAPTPAPLHAWYEKMGMPLCEIYGQSEILSGISSTPTMRKLGYVGKVMPNMKVRFADSGEILLGSNARMIGYWNDPVKTAETITDDGFIRTGDKGQMDQDGFIRITGRVKELFKTAKGKYVAPVPIESHFAQNLQLEQVCLMGSGYPQTMVVATLSPEGLARDIHDVKQDMQQLLEEINTKVEHHEQIAAALLVPTPWTMEDGYLTHTMKLKREVIEDEYMELLGSHIDKSWHKIQVLELAELT